ncbi:hypothetical protein DL98DRAFT_571219 [Cadophora sp. DSE1049]|nr:hypothetical protein DL98DRAFT_571219 [Cadophora sp. DSE1049]
MRKSMLHGLLGIATFAFAQDTETDIPSPISSSTLSTSTLPESLCPCPSSILTSVSTITSTAYLPTIDSLGDQTCRTTVTITDTITELPTGSTQVAYVTDTATVTINATSTETSTSTEIRTVVDRIRTTEVVDVTKMRVEVEWITRTAIVTKTMGCDGEREDSEGWEG